jgi:dihydrofolate reductase
MSIYKQLIGYCSKMYITKYEEKEIIEADSHFPEIDEKLWKVTEKVEGKNENPKLTFYTYERI